MNRKNILISFALLLCGYVTYTQDITSDISLSDSQESLAELEKKIAKAKSKKEKLGKVCYQTEEGKMFLQARRFLRWCNEGVGVQEADCSSFQMDYKLAKTKLEQTSAFKQFDKVDKKYKALYRQKYIKYHS